MLKRFVLISGTFMLLSWGCKKNQANVIQHNVKAGDTTSQGIHFVSYNASFGNIPGLVPTVNLDIDQDGINDIQIHYASSVSDSGNPCAVHFSKFTVQPFDSAKNVFFAIAPDGAPPCLQAGAQIGSVTNWQNGKALLSSYVYSLAPCKDQTPQIAGNWYPPGGYLGFKIEGKSKTYIGWIWLGWFDINGYAYLEY